MKDELKLEFGNDSIEFMYFENIAATSKQRIAKSCVLVPDARSGCSSK
jgi:hypothetical protein